jgi:chromosome condensin MukBEF MukE localization factor
METYIALEDVIANIRVYRNSLSYDDQFDFDMETKRMKLSDKHRKKLKNTVRASEHRMNRYGVHKDKMR